MTDAHDLVAAFPRERTWLLPASHAGQEARGWPFEAALRDAASQEVDGAYRGRVRVGDLGTLLFGAAHVHQVSAAAPSRPGA